MRMFLAQVMGDYRKREPFWRSEIRPLRGWKTIAYAGKSPVLRMLDMLGRRLDSVKWLGQQSGLHLKAQIAEEMLIAAESDSQNSHVRALMSTEFMTYLQAAVLTIDCASVAVCDNRERAVSWILTPMRS